MEEEKKLPKLVIDYRRSGIKTLREFSVVMIIIAIGAPVVGIALSTLKLSETPLEFFISVVVSFICIMFRAFLLAFAGIAETNLLKKSEIMRRNQIINADALTSGEVKKFLGGNIL